MSVEKPEKCPNCGSDKMEQSPHFIDGLNFYYCSECKLRIDSTTGEIINSGASTINDKKPFERPEKCPNCKSVAIFHVCGVPKHHKSLTWCTDCAVPGAANLGHIVCDDCGWGVDAVTGEAAFSGDVNEPQKPEPKFFIGDKDPIGFVKDRQKISKEIKRIIGFKRILRQHCCANCNFIQGTLCIRWDPIIIRHGGDRRICEYHEAKK